MSNQSGKGPPNLRGIIAHASTAQNDGTSLLPEVILAGSIRMRKIKSTAPDMVLFNNIEKITSRNTVANALKAIF